MAIDVGEGETPTYKCSYCGANSKTRCANCKKVSYCTKDCQTKDWKFHKDACIAMEIKPAGEQKDKRAHVFVTKDLKAGDVIGKETPLVTAPINTLNYEKHRIHHTNVLCVVCCKALSPKEVKPCVQCGRDMCGAPACARDKTHATVECPIFKKQKSRFVYFSGIVPTDYIFLLRVMNLKQSNPAAWEKFMSLNPNYDRIHLENYSEAHKEVNGELLRYLIARMPTFDLATQRYVMRLGGAAELFTKDTGADESCIKELDVVLDLLDSNCLDDETPHYEDFWSTHMKWIGHYGGSSAHSCSPNVTWKINSKKQVVYGAIISIKAGEEVFISKDPAGLANGTAKRREILQDQKGFLCKCDRCTDPTELGSYYSALKCQENNCAGYYLMTDPLMSRSGTSWTCDTNCDHELDNCEVPELSSIMAQKCIEIHAKLMESKGKDMPGFVDDMQKLVKEYEKLAHPNHHMLRMIREKMVFKIFEQFIIDIKLVGSMHKCHEIDCQGNRNRKKIMIPWAKLVISECKYALQECNPATTGFTRLRGHTLVQYQVALAFLFHFGSQKDVEEVGLTKLDMYGFELEAAQILEFYAEEISYDAEFIQLMKTAKTYLSHFG